MRGCCLAWGRLSANHICLTRCGPCSSSLSPRAPPDGGAERHGDRTALCGCLVAEGGRAGVERTEQACHLDRRDTAPAQLGGQRRRVRGVGRAEAAVAPPVYRWAEGTAPCPGHRAEAGRPVGHQHANVPAPFTLLAHRMAGDDRSTSGQRGGEHLEQLVTVDRTAVELEIDSDVGRDRRGGVERRYVLGVRVDSRGCRPPPRRRCAAPGPPRRWRTHRS